MAKILATLLIVAGTILAFRGFSVWTRCGYDCPALPYINVSATFALLIAVLLTIAGLSLALGTWLSRIADGG